MLGLIWSEIFACLNRKALHLPSKLEDSEQRFMRSSCMLLITALVGVRQHVGVYFLPSSSNQAVGTSPQCKDGANAPRAHSITAHLAVIEKHWRILVRIPETRRRRKFSGKCVEIHKMVDFSQTMGAAKATRVRSCPKRCQLGAQKEPACSSDLNLRRLSHGAICSINTPAVINTVLRQPMAWKRLREGGGGGVEWERLQLWLSSLPYFSCHFVPVITPKMVAGL